MPDKGLLGLPPGPDPRLPVWEVLLEDEATDGAVTLVEWPDRAAGALGSARLDITLDVVSADEPEQRVAILVGTGVFGERLLRARALKAMLEAAGWIDAVRAPLHGDASSRAYERLTKPGGETAILMISPRRPDGPPIRQGRSYSEIARLAESVHPFVAMDRGLRALGFSAPRIYGEALDEGLLLLEDLGGEPVVDASGPIPERYAKAARLLVQLHTTTLPHVLPVAEEIEHVIPAYDAQALAIEVELLLDWYMRLTLGAEVSGSARADFVNGWGEAIEEVLAQPTTWCLRDYHSPNLIWQPEREGVARVGIIDFQDATLGHPAYDLVSLLQDARVSVPSDLELKLLSLYARERRVREPGFDVAAFARAYAILGAQRATKILGIFTRLDRRDGKSAYLAHIPRVEAYLARNLAHPALARVKAWYETHAPRLAGGDSGAAS